MIGDHKSLRGVPFLGSVLGFGFWVLRENVLAVACLVTTIFMKEDCENRNSSSNKLVYSLKNLNIEFYFIYSLILAEFGESVLQFLNELNYPGNTISQLSFSD